MKVYKAVIWEENEYHSAVAYAVGWMLTYHLGKQLTPKVGMIYAFSSLKDAKQWMSNGARWDQDNVAILECEAEGVIRKPVITEWAWSSKFSAFWEEYNKAVKRHRKRPPSLSVPKGTVMCKSVTPKRIVAYRKPCCYGYERETGWRD